MYDSNSFTNTFSENYNIRYSAKQLEYFEKWIVFFLLNFFTCVYQNFDKSKVVLFNVYSKFKVYEFLTFATQVNIKTLTIV